MKKSISMMTLAAAVGMSAPAGAQLHVAQGNPPPALFQNPAAAPAPALPDASKVLSRADAAAFAAAEFAFADADKDLKITKSEFAALDRARKEKAAAATSNESAPADAPPPSDGVPGAKPADAQYADIVGKAAAIDQKALADARLAAFARADLDADGQLSKAENAAFAALVSGKSAL
ncbi:MAG: hypothetical protein HXY23_07280 [Parvularculaceae bacterium]|jgi:hypothetical protein|nr:hypothetical protein [Parvularculaceae bacterium]